MNNYLWMACGYVLGIMMASITFSFDWWLLFKIPLIALWLFMPWMLEWLGNYMMRGQQRLDKYNGER